MISKLNSIWKSIKETCSPLMTGLYVAGFILFFEATYLLNSQPEQGDFNEILMYYALAFVGFWIIISDRRTGMWTIFGAGLIARIMLFLFPNLSDDIYRFIWDGRLLHHGINPLTMLPNEVLALNLSGFDEPLYSAMNSTQYHTVYPPVSQLVFYLSTFDGSSIAESAQIMKMILFTGEVFTLYGVVMLLQHMRLTINLSALYFLNPLVIVEGIGNLHFEVLMIAFLVWFLYFIFVKSDQIWSSGFLALSIGVKLFPLLLIPYLFFKMKSQKVLFFGLLSATLLLIFLPFMWGAGITNMGSSLDLYFQKFEFNASVYYILRYIGSLLAGYNLISIIGPLLALITTSFTVFWSWTNKWGMNELLHLFFASFLLYLFLSTTIHPWYLILPIFLGVFTTFRFIYFWSFLITLTYINYSYDSYFENLWVVSFEYAIVFAILIFELRKIKNNENKTGIRNYIRS